MHRPTCTLSLLVAIAVSSEGRAEPVAERMRSTRSRPGAAPPEAILCNDTYLHGHVQALAPVGPDALLQALWATSANHKV